MIAESLIRKQFEEAGQGQVFAFWSQLNAEQQQSLLKQLQEIDPIRINAIFKQATSTAPQTPSSSPQILEPLSNDCFDDIDLSPQQSITGWRQTGLDAIRLGKVGVLLLAGGQGTRLGSASPKGCYDINLVSHKSLFQIQAERIKHLQDLCSSPASNAKSPVIPWYVMTSGPTRAETERFFVENKFFGLQQANVVFFEQGVLPALTPDGKIILEDKDRVSVAPDGNGGVYAALRQCRIVEDMKKRGLLYIHAYCVDNCLVRVADPVFIGHSIAKHAVCGAKVVRKAFPHEPVGVVCKVGGKFGVVEYSEIKKEDAEARRPDGRLLYDAANIANHFYAVDFLERVCSREFEQQLMFHVASKKIKYIDTQTGQQVSPSKPNGIKLELFIFDIFPFISQKSIASMNLTSAKDSTTPFTVLSVPRNSEFSPLKNAPGAGIDNPETSRRDLFEQSLRFLKNAGAVVNIGPKAEEEIKLKKEGEAGECIVKVGRIEISPLISYDGEGLSEHVSGHTLVFNEPAYIDSIAKLKSFIVQKK